MLVLKIFYFILSYFMFDSLTQCMSFPSILKYFENNITLPTHHHILLKKNVVLV